jgi:uncharacterized protein YegJ (DUF2314 family)
MFYKTAVLVILACVSVGAAGAQGTEPAPDNKAKIVAGPKARAAADTKAPAKKERKEIVENREKRGEKHVKIIAEPKAKEVAE